VRAAIVASLLFAVSAARAQTTPPPPEYVFVTVDSVYVYSYQLKITGILQGESAPVERTVTPGGGEAGNAANCMALALRAMEKPGAYLFALRKDPYSSYFSCRLTRVIP
jgi:hypothetical protein